MEKQLLNTVQNIVIKGKIAHYLFAEFLSKSNLLQRRKEKSVCEKGFTFNPFPHIDAFRRLCSRQLFENIVTKEEIAQIKQFLLLPQYFPLLVIGNPFN